MDNVMYLVMFIPAVIVIERNMRLALILALGLSVVGTWIALFVDVMGVKIVGQLLIDSGFPFAISAVTKISAAWFPMQERFYATSFSTLAAMIGYALGDGALAAF